MTIKEMIRENEAKGMSKAQAQIEVGKKVKAMIESGYSNKEVAEELGISESSVRLVRSRHEA